jgi:hypothetical protein
LRRRTGQICPRGDIDHYWFQVEEARTIVEVHLRNNAPMSAVDLCYDLFHASQDIRLGGLCDSDGMDGETDILGTHYLEFTGNYFLEVRDESADEDDPRAPYFLSIQTMPDPDDYEPNNHMGEAKAPTSAKGYISFLGDQDWFEVEVTQPGQILLIDLSNDAASPVDLQYTLLMPDGTTPVNAGSDENGMDGPTTFDDVLPLNGTGTFYLRISDINDDDSDLEVGYTLSLSQQQNPDAEDRNDPPNNTPENATSLTSGVASSGYIATRGDVDWFVIEVPGVNDSDNTKVLEVDLVTASSSLEMAVDLLVADPHNTPCDPSSTDTELCQVLEIPCGGAQQTAELAHARCPSHECWMDRQKCKGSGDCLNGGSIGYGCGIRQLIMHTDEWSETGDANHLHTAAPMFGERYYFFVRDYWSMNHDFNNSYTLTVTVHDEPDSWEYNGLYLPYLTEDQEDDTRRYNRNLAKTVECTEDAVTGQIDCPTITGYLSYRGDQDWYKLIVSGQSYFVPLLPEEAPEGLSQSVDYGVSFHYVYEAGMKSNLDIAFNFPFGAQNLGTEQGQVPVGPGEGWLTGADCQYYCGEYGDLPANNVYLWVFTPAFDKYDFEHSYNITISATRGCPVECEFCEPGQNCWACPNPGNPNPDPEQCLNP